MKILVADDSRSVRGMLVSLLKSEGYDVLQAEDGIEALELAIGEQPPQMAVLDWEMPRMDGIDVCREIRRSDKKSMYVIMLTSKGEKDSIVKGLTAGADDYLVKPFSPEELNARIRSGARLIEMHEQQLEIVMELQHHQRMRSVGALAAGVAHEINTPSQYLLSNANFLKESYEVLGKGFERVFEMAEAVRAGTWNAQKTEKLFEYMESLDVEYLLSEVPTALRESIEGIESISKIVGALKEFSVPSGSEKSTVDVNRALGNTVDVSIGRWRPYATVAVSKQGEIPLVRGFSSELNQCFLAIFENAIEAIRRRFKDGELGVVTITTAHQQDTVTVSIKDNGSGISDEIKDEIFNPFFTTKKEGEGMGQGLSLAYETIVNKHGGTISFKSHPQKGTLFKITLPVQG